MTRLTKLRNIISQHGPIRSYSKSCNMYKYSRHPRVCRETNSWCLHDISLRPMSGERHAIIHQLGGATGGRHFRVKMPSFIQHNSPTLAAFSGGCAPLLSWTISESLFCAEITALGCPCPGLIADCDTHQTCHKLEHGQFRFLVLWL